jgi:outer membrane translocation and assembly module TamA
MPVKSLMSVESSSFLNSLQLVGFTDVGTAWTGSSPFEKSNGFNTNVYGGNTNPFQATVTDFRNPFLMGYGMGARANVFGYFVKFDYAFGLENKEVKSPVTYLTLGYDF